MSAICFEFATNLGINVSITLFGMDGYGIDPLPIRDRHILDRYADIFLDN